MNKQLILMISSSALLLGACNEITDAGNETASNSDVTVEELQARIAELEEENETLRQSNGDSSSVNEDSSSVAEDGDDEEVVEVDSNNSQGSGTRSNPYVYGETANLQGTFTDYDADWEDFDADLDITVIESIRGEEAWTMVQNENSHNKPAPEGMEYIINRVKISLLNATSEDLKASFNSSDFDYISNSGSSYSKEFAVYPDELRVELFNNGEAEGNVLGVVDINDTPLLRFDSSFFFETE